MKRRNVLTRNADELPDVVGITELAYFLSWSELTIKRKIAKGIFPVHSESVHNPDGGPDRRIFRKEDILKVYLNQI